MRDWNRSVSQSRTENLVVAARLATFALSSVPGSVAASAASCVSLHGRSLGQDAVEDTVGTSSLSLAVAAGPGALPRMGMAMCDCTSDPQRNLTVSRCDGSGSARRVLLLVTNGSRLYESSAPERALCGDRAGRSGCFSRADPFRRLACDESMDERRTSICPAKRIPG